MNSNSQVSISHLLFKMTVIANNAQFTFGDLTGQQLNWKPSPDTWSIAQCFDHLTAASKAYMPIIEQVSAGKKQSTFSEKIPLLPNIFGKLLIKYLSPQSTRKLKAPELIRPAASSIDEGIIRHFIEVQKEMIVLMKKTEGLNLSRIRITSPLARFVAYNLMDAYEIIVAHQKRHFRQAERVLTAEAFPRK